MNKRIVSFITCIVVLFVTVIYPNTSIIVNATEQNSLKEENITKYIPEGKTKESAHTIYWAKGITPPKMPGTIESESTVETKGNFSLIDMKNGNIVKSKDELTTTTTVSGQKSSSFTYATDFVQGAGWYDAKKFTPYDVQGAPTEDQKIDGVSDSNLCWAGAAANTLQWWMNINRDLVYKYAEMNKESDGLAEPAEVLNYFAPESFGKPSDAHKVENNPIYRLLRKAAIEDKGGYPNLAFDFFLNGYKITNHERGRNNENSFVPDNRGGFFHAAFGKKLLSSINIQSKSYDYMKDSFKEWLTKGYGIVISHKVLTGAHAITLWGAEYDENGQLCGLYVTDSNEGYTYFGEKHKNHNNVLSMKRYEAFKDRNNLVSITNENNPRLRGTNSLYGAMLLVPGTEALKYFVDNSGNRMPVEGNYFPDGDLEYKPHQHDFEYITEGNTFIKRCKVRFCTERHTIRVGLKDKDSYVYTGRQIKPNLSLIHSGNNFMIDMSKDISYENNINAGNKTAKVIITKNGQRIELPFTITKANQDAPMAPVASEIKADSITLNTSEGMEFSMNGGEWTTNNIFENLKPSTSYVFKARLKENNNHFQSPESSEITITTLEKNTQEYKVTLEGTLMYDETLTAIVESSLNREKIQYFWYRGKGNTKELIKKGNENTYKLGVNDINEYITVEINVDGYTGVVEAVSDAAVSKAYATLDNVNGHYTVDYINERIIANYDSEIKDTELGKYIIEKNVKPGDIIKIRLSETNTHFASNEMEIKISERPSNPTGLQSIGGRITGVTDKMEYKPKSATDWIKVNGSEIKGLKVGEEIEVRYNATKDSFYSESTVITVLGKNQINDLTVKINNWEYGKKSSEPIVTSAISLKNEPILIYKGTLGNGEVYSSNELPINPGKYTIKAKYEDDNYIGESSEVPFEILKSKSITLSGLSVEDKIFNKTDLAKLKGELVIEGIVNGDNVTVGDISVNGNFNSSNIGNNKEVITTVTGKIGGNDSWKYVSPTKYTKSLQGNIVPVSGAIISGNDVVDIRLVTDKKVDLESEKVLLNEASKVFTEGRSYKTYIMDLELQELQSNGEYIYNPNALANILLPYPEGKDSSYDFVILHLKDGKVEKSKFNKLPEGIEIVNTTTSPFAIVVANKYSNNLGDDLDPNMGIESEETDHQESKPEIKPEESQKPGNGQESNNDTNSNGVKTGDTSNFYLYILASLLGIVSMYIARKKIFCKR